MHERLLLAVLTSLPLAAACSDGAPTYAMVPKPERADVAAAGPFPGFTLFAPLTSNSVYLVDMAGEAVHRWVAPRKPGEMAYLTERGTILAAQRTPDDPHFQDAGGGGGRIVEIDVDGTILWEFDWNGDHGSQHHDLEELPNGNVLFVAWDRTTREEALAAGRDPELLEGAEFWAGAIYEVKPTRPKGGEIVWSWHAMDHLIQDYDEDLAGYGRPSDHPERIDINGDRDPEPPTPEEEAEEAAAMAAIGYAGGGDDPEEDDGDEEDAEEEEDPEEAARKARVKDADWMHTNAVAYNAALDQIAISVRRFDEIWVIDHSISREEAKGPKGDLLYRWGNPFAYGMGEYEDRPLLGQHNVQWIPQGQLGAGNLIVFNNGSRDRRWSTLLEWWAPRDESGRYPRAEGEPWGPAEPEWTYEAEEPKSFHSPFISGVQRLPNGNTLACSGAPGRVFEVTPAGEIVWDWRSPFTRTPEEVDDRSLKDHPTAMFRALRYAPDHPGIVALRAKGATIPDDPGAGPPTNQYVPPPAEDEEAEK
ncbi:MAG: aryl-sulfate sulfotransferase [Planctomycetota bacterium]